MKIVGYYLSYCLQVASDLVAFVSSQNLLKVKVKLRCLAPRAGIAEVSGESKKGAMFDRLLLTEYLSNDI